MKWCWKLTLLIGWSLSLTLQEAQAAQPYILPLDDTIMQKNPFLVKIAENTTRDLHHSDKKELPDSKIINRKLNRKISRVSKFFNNLSSYEGLNVHKEDLRGQNFRTKVNIDNHFHLWDCLVNRRQQKKLIFGLKSDPKLLNITANKNTTNISYIDYWNTSRKWKNTTQLDPREYSTSKWKNPTQLDPREYSTSKWKNTTQLDRREYSTSTHNISGPAGQRHRHIRNKEFQRKIKQETYRKLVTQALQQHLQAHKQFMKLVKLGGLIEPVIHQWFRLILEPDAVHSDLQNVQNETDRRLNTVYALKSLENSSNMNHDNVSVLSSVNRNSTDHDEVDVLHNLKKQKLNYKTSQNNGWPKTLSENTIRFSNPRPVKTKSDSDAVLSLVGDPELRLQNKGPRPWPQRQIPQSRKPSRRKHLLSFLKKLIMASLTSTSTLPVVRHRRSGSEGVMYLPVGGQTKVTCPTAADAAGVSLAQMAFLSVCLAIFNLVINVSNNINNNNNNNNINSDNNLSNNNAQLSLNDNNGNQVNVMLPPPIPGRRRREWHIR